MTKPRWQLGYSGNDATLSMPTPSDPLEQRWLAKAERSHKGGWDYTIDGVRWYCARNLVEAQKLAEATLILQGVIEP